LSKNRLFEEVDFEKKSERAKEIPEHTFLIQNFKADLMVQKPDFYRLQFGRYLGKKNGKNQEILNSPL
jgi:hypothetical protein